MKKDDFSSDESSEVKNENQGGDPSYLYVHNDNYNTFEYVIEKLKSICGHTEEQAQQCTILIHFIGKCKVKKGTKEQLVPMKEGIKKAGINATID